MPKQQVVFKQKEVLANFYANFAIVWLTYGFVAPLFYSPKDLVDNYLIIIVRLIISVLVTKIFLNIAINKLK